MKVINLLPADIYTVVNKTVLTEKDKDILITLYMPIIGALPVALYLSLWSDLDKLQVMSIDLTHHHLMSVLKTDLETIKKARETLEGVGLLKSYLCSNGDVNKYAYLLYSPLTASEFFNHPVLNVVLYNNMGKYEYDILKKKYEKLSIDLNGYEDITKMMNMVFKSSTEPEKVDIKTRESVGINISEVVNFDTLIGLMPRGLINERTFNKRVRDLINNLAFVYNIDTLKMAEILRLVIDDGKVNSEELKKNVRKYYQYNNGKLPTLVYRSQPEYLKSPMGDTSNKAKIIYVFENTSPYDFLRSKNKGSAPTSRDLKLVEYLITEIGLKPAVVNVVVDYVLKKNNNRLDRNYMEAIASQLKRNGVETALDALESIQKEQKKINKKVPSVKVSKEKPVWFDETITKEELNEEESKELEEFLKELG